MDLILGPFADRFADEMDEDRLNELEHLLTAQDQDLYDWLLDRSTVDTDYDGPVFRAIQAHVRAPSK